MIRKALLLSVTIGAAALLTAPPAAAISAVERRALACPSQTLGSVDVPADGATVSGYVQVRGYALDGNLVFNVDVFVDGTDDANRSDGAARTSTCRGPTFSRISRSTRGRPASTPAGRRPSRRRTSRTGPTRSTSRSRT